MNLLRHLVLANTQTLRLEDTPTKRYFKTVMLVSAPIESETAGLIGCSHMWDASGNPVDFEGTYKLKGELSGADIVLQGQTVGPLELKTEKVCRFALWREEKKGMKLRLRCHLPELDPERCFELRKFLAEFNKEPYTFTVKDAQGSLIQVLSGEGKEDLKWKPAEPDASGLYDQRRAIARPFSNKKLKAKIFTIQTSDGFVCGWSLESNLRTPKTLGDAMSVRSTVFASESGARESAVCQIYQAVSSDVFPVDGKAEEKAVAELKDWLIDLVPALAHKGASNGDA